MAGKGSQLKRPKKGQLVFGKHLWPIVDFINAFINGEIVAGKSYELIISDRKIIWKVKSSTAGGGSSSYRGEYDPDGALSEFLPGPYLFGHMVLVSPLNGDATTTGGTIIPGTYVCIHDNPTATDLPVHPLSGVSTFWRWISTHPSVRQVCDEDGNATNIFVDGQDEP